MPTFSDVLVGLLAAYVLVSEFLDTIGRLDIIQDRWPKVWGVLNNRPMRLILIVFLAVLVAKDISDRVHEKVAELKVTMPSIPAPIIQMTTPEKPKEKAVTTLPIPPPSSPGPASPHVGHLTVSQISEISTRPEYPYRLRVVIQSDIDFPSLMLMLECSSNIGEERGGIEGGMSMNIANSGINRKDASKWYIYYSSAVPPFGPSNPIVVDLYAAGPISCNHASTY
jgi:hypothetical protein